ncbi:MAG: TetR/AcrR family transcriptional regulator [Actinomycetota bacterium]|nr:TetR/AcrR family transcriptional regulator [Actinomycetota bacterium]
MLDAATDLFVEQGWSATTVDQIAARAGTSRPTVFALGSKARLLKLARDVAMAGDDEDLAVSQRQSAQRVLAEPDPERCLERLAMHVTGVVERYAPLDEVLRHAAHNDPELTELWRTSEAQRRTGARLFIDNLALKGRLNGSRSTMVDVLWLLMAPDQYCRLVRDRGWSRRRYVTWLAAAMAALLLAPS